MAPFEAVDDALKVRPEIIPGVRFHRVKKKTRIKNVITACRACPSAFASASEITTFLFHKKGSRGCSFHGFLFRPRMGTRANPRTEIAVRSDCGFLAS